MNQIDSASLSAAMQENRKIPNGAARNANAETIVEQADQLGDQARITEALIGLINAYEYSSESHKILVPFARLLHRFDRNPEYFDQWDLHSLFWYFKWVTSGMLSNPDVPLSAIEHWLAEMRRRYQIAGYGPHAVHKVEWSVSNHIGDDPRADRAFAQWQASERDKMSDCHACDCAGAGRHFVDVDDARALELWQPVLTGELSCAEEPHHVLAATLLPLMRLGRADEARANHLRGYRMIRQNDSLISRVADHIEFCALTGNEARGLEILAEHRRYIDGIHDAADRRRFLEGVAVLLHRLIEIDAGDRAIGGPENRDWPVTELRDWVTAELTRLWQRFDDRNGTDAISRAGRDRLARRPFPEPVNLGVTSSVRLPAPRTASPEPEPVVDELGDLDVLIAEATRLNEVDSPDAHDHWIRIGALADRNGVELPPFARAAVLSVNGAERYATDQAEAIAMWQTALELYEQLGEIGLAAGRRAWLLTTRAERGESVIEEADALVAEMSLAHHDGRVSGPHYANLLVSRSVIEVLDIGGDPDERRIREATERLIGWDAELADFPPSPQLPRRRLELAVARIDMCGRAGDEAEMVRIGAQARELALAADNAGMVVRTTALISDQVAADAGLDEAAKLATEALAADVDHHFPHQTAELHLLLAKIGLDTNDLDSATEQARLAGQWYEEADNDAAAAYARHLVGVAYFRQGRPSEAATVLESVLPTLDELEPQAGFNARGVLCQALMAIGENSAAAEYAGTAAARHQNDPERFRYAHFASVATDALRADDRIEAAMASASAAAQAWRDAGEWGNYAALTRMRIEMRDDEEALESGEFTALVDELTRLIADGELADLVERLRMERAHTLREHAHSLWRHLDGVESTHADRRREVLALSRAAYADYRAIGFEQAMWRLDGDMVWQIAEAGDPQEALAYAAEALARIEDNEENASERARITHAAGQAGLSEPQTD